MVDGGFDVGVAEDIAQGGAVFVRGVLAVTGADEDGHGPRRLRCLHVNEVIADEGDAAEVGQAEMACLVKQHAGVGFAQGMVAVGARAVNDAVNVAAKFTGDQPQFVVDAGEGGFIKDAVRDTALVGADADADAGLGEAGDTAQGVGEEAQFFGAGDASGFVQDTIAVEEDEFFVEFDHGGTGWDSARSVALRHERMGNTRSRYQTGADAGFVPLGEARFYAAWRGQVLRRLVRGQVLRRLARPGFAPLGEASIYAAWRDHVLRRLARPGFTPLGETRFYAAWRGQVLRRLARSGFTPLGARPGFMPLGGWDGSYGRCRV